MFSKEERSKFPYWFAHWCAFNMTALNLKHWRFRYLFHDFEKPWLRLFLPYEKVQRFHRYHSPHHSEFFVKNGWLHWDDMIIDWECSHFTKTAAPWLADEVIDKEIEKLKALNPTDEQFEYFVEKSHEALRALGLDKKEEKEN